MKIKDPGCLRYTPGGAGGGPLKSNGKAVMDTQMGPLCFNHICVVGDILNKVLL